MASLHSFLMSLAIGLPVISLLIIVHEFGHFIVAKMCGVGVLKFAIGFGPTIFKKRFGETEYQLSPILLGGFVRMVGDMPDPITGEQVTDKSVREDAKEELSENKADLPPEVQAMLNDKSRWFIEKGFWAKSAVVVAGPFFNLLLAVVLVTFAIWTYGEERVIEGPVIGSIQKGSPAERAGIADGDRITKINGKDISSWDSLAEHVRESNGESLSIDIDRAGKPLTVQVQPKTKTLPGANGQQDKNVYLIGVERKFERHSAGFLDAIGFGVSWSTSVVVKTYEGLFGIIRGAVSPKELAGPLFIFGEARSQAKKGFEDLLYFTALLSVSLAVLNLLPIPILDGGHLLFFVIEALLGPISVKKKEFAQGIGFAVLLLLMLFAISNDITREMPDKQKGVEWETSP